MTASTPATAEPVAPPAAPVSVIERRGLRIAFGDLDLLKQPGAEDSSPPDASLNTPQSARFKKVLNILPPG